MDGLDPKVGEMIEHIRNNLNYKVDQGKTDDENLIDAYGKVMNYFEQKGIEPTVANIDAHKQELNNLLNNLPIEGVKIEQAKKENFWSKLTQKQKIGGIIILLIILYLLFFRKSKPVVA